MNLSEAFRRIKRRTGYGVVGQNSDTATQDILDAWNDICDMAWLWKSWPFSLDAISEALEDGTSDYTFESTEGDIVVLYLSGSTKPLHKYTWEEYLRWHSTIDEDDTSGEGEIFGYIPLGNDSDDNQQIRIIRTPSESKTLIGFSKKRLTPYEVADIATNTLLQYFPREFHQVLIDGAIGMVRGIQGKAELADAIEKRFYQKLDKMWETEKQKPANRITSPLPPMYRSRRRARGGTTVA